MSANEWLDILLWVAYVIVMIGVVAAIIKS
jgi:hypothetical protein